MQPKSEKESELCMKEIYILKFETFKGSLKLIQDVCLYQYHAEYNDKLLITPNIQNAGSILENVLIFHLITYKQTTEVLFISQNCYWVSEISH